MHTLIAGLAMILGVSLHLGALHAQATTDSAQPAPQPDSGVGYRTVSEALAALKSKPGVNITTTKPDGWTIANESGGMGQWSFTPPGHYAYPAVVKRVVKQRPNGDVFVEMTGLCEAQKTACDKLIEEFKELNDRMAENVQRRLQRK